MFAVLSSRRPTDGSDTALSVTAQHNTPAAIAFMTLAVICFSWIPLTISANDGESSPLLFSSTWRAGALTTYIIALLALYRPLLNRRDLGRTLKLLTQSPYRRLIAIEAASTLDYALFALSTRYIDVAATAIAFEIWPITVMLILARLYHRKIPVRTYILAPICFPGFLSVATGEQGGLPELQDTVTANPTTPVSAAIGLTIGGPAEFPTLLSQPGPEALKVTAGGALLAGGAIMWQSANARTPNLGINTLNYLTPALIPAHGCGYSDRWDRSIPATCSSEQQPSLPRT